MKGLINRSWIPRRPGKFRKVYRYRKKNFWLLPDFKRGKYVRNMGGLSWKVIK